MATNLEKLLNQYAERINELQIQVAKLQDELETYQSEVPEAEKPQEGECDCFACTMEKIFGQREDGKQADESGGEDLDAPRGEVPPIEDILRMLSGTSVGIRVVRKG